MCATRSPPPSTRGGFDPSRAQHWDSSVRSAAWAYYNTIHTAHGYTPPFYSLMVPMSEEHSWVPHFLIVHLVLALDAAPVTVI
jgi:hypothetical protein